MGEEQGHALPLGSKLRACTIDRILGCGSFGATYLATDAHTDRQVAIKEYLPVGFARRALSANPMHVHS